MILKMGFARRDLLETKIKGILAKKRGQKHMSFSIG